MTGIGRISGKNGGTPGPRLQATAGGLMIPIWYRRKLAPSLTALALHGCSMSGSAARATRQALRNSAGHHVASGAGEKRGGGRSTSRGRADRDGVIKQSPWATCSHPSPDHFASLPHPFSAQARTAPPISLGPPSRLSLGRTDGVADLLHLRLPGRGDGYGAQRHPSPLPHASWTAMLLLCTGGTWAVGMAFPTSPGLVCPLQRTLAWILCPLDWSRGAHGRAANGTA